MKVRDGRSEGPLVVLVLLGAAAWALAAPVHDAASLLSAAAVQGIRSAFPTATIRGVEREIEDGVMLYAVQLQHQGRILEVEVTRDGAIGEIETVLGLEDVPEEVARAIAKASGGRKILLIEKHERRGVPRSGRFVTLDVPVLFYLVEFQANGGSHEVEIPADPAWGLSQRAREAIQKTFPRAVVRQVELEREMGLKLYEVELEQDGKALEVTVSPDGVIAQVDVTVTKRELPKAVADAIAKAAAGATILELEREEVRALPRLVELEDPQVTYEAEFVRDGKKYEVEVAPDGTITEEEQDEAGDDED